MPQAAIAAIPAVVGAGASLFGARNAARSADADRALAQNQIARLAQVGFNPEDVGLFGAGVNFGPGGASFNGGPFNQRFNQLGFLGEQGLRDAFFTNQLANRGLADVMQNQQGANLLAQSALQDALAGPDAGLSQMFGGFAGQAGGAFGTGARRGLQAFDESLGLGNAQLARSGFFGDEAAQGFDDLRSSTLATLREQAAPFESRALSDLQDQLFAQGRLGSTGGDRSFEAFARGLGQADLQRQLTAANEARQTRGQAGNLASQFGQLGSALRSSAAGQLGAGTALDSMFANTAQGFGGLGLQAQRLEDQLLSNAFGRFGSTAGLAADLQGGIAGRGAQQLQQGLAALGGQTGIMDALLNLGTFGANLGAQRANTDLAAAGGAVQGVGTLGPSGSDLTSAALANFGGNLFERSGGFGSIADAFGSLFGGNNQLQEIDMSTLPQRRATPGGK